MIAVKILGETDFDDVHLCLCMPNVHGAPGCSSLRFLSLWMVGGCGHCPALVCMEKVTAIVSPRLLGGAFHLFFDVQTSF
jgi:hypothetical protein